MAKFFMTGADRQKVQNTISIVNGGSGNNRPIPRRRRQVVSEGATATGTQTALLTASLPAATVDATEKKVALEATQTEVVTLLTLGVGDSDAIQMVPRTKDDPTAPEPPAGQSKPQVDVTLRAINGTQGFIYADTVQPRLVQGYSATLEIGGASSQFFVVTSAITNSVIHGSPTSAIAESQQSGSIAGGISVNGIDPFAGGGSVTVQNVFGFAIDEGALLRAEQSDGGDWIITQAECSV